MAASVAGITYAVFDPIRAFFIQANVTQRFNPDEYALYRWLRRETWARLLDQNRDDTGGDVGAGADREEDGDKIREWLNESPGEFIDSYLTWSAHFFDIFLAWKKRLLLWVDQKEVESRL